jgi:plastocyanin
VSVDVRPFLASHRKMRISSLFLGAASLSLVVAGFVACTSEASDGTTAGDAGPDAPTTVDAGKDASADTGTGTDAATDSGSQLKSCTDAELAAAPLATNGSDVSFFIDGGALEYTNNCVRIPQGKDVGWYGDFTIHPLANNGEPGSPIPSVTTGNDSGRIAFPNKGKFSFHCTAHPSTMYGTVLVE